MPRPPTHCPICRAPLTHPARGRPRATCSDACRQSLWRYRHARCGYCRRLFSLPVHTPYRQKRFCSKRCGVMDWRRRRIIEAHAATNTFKDRATP